MSNMSTVDSPLVGVALLCGVLSIVKYLQLKPATISVSEIWIYPIKSCKGFKVKSAKVSKKGFVHDREFMLVDAKGKFVSQRTFPKMALIETSVFVDRGVLEVNAPGMRTLIVPLSTTQTTTTLEVDVWGDLCQAVQVLDAENNKWFRDFLDAPAVTLVKMVEGFKRPTEPKYSPNGQVSFADGFPFLLVSEASMAGLNKTLDTPMTLERFRANIIVKNCAPFAEDKWTDLQFLSSNQPSDVKMTIVKPCARCQMPNVDPATGVPDANNQPTKAMKGFRKGETVGYKEKRWAGQLYFGQNVDHEGQEGKVISVGDTLVVGSTPSRFLD